MPMPIRNKNFIVSFPLKIGLKLINWSANDNNLNNLSDEFMVASEAKIEDEKKWIVTSYWRKLQYFPRATEGSRVIDILLFTCSPAPRSYFWLDCHTVMHAKFPHTVTTFSSCIPSGLLHIQVWSLFLIFY